MMKRDTINSPKTISNNVILTLIYLTLSLVIGVTGQNASIKLEQGTVVGVLIAKYKAELFSVIIRILFVFQLKVFPEASRTPVYSYLGIPYAQPPIGKLRFAVN